MTATATAKFRAGQWWRMTTGGGNYLRVGLIKPTGGIVRTLGAGGLGPAVATWAAIDENGAPHEANEASINRLGIGCLTGPIDDLPALDAEMIQALRGKHEQSMFEHARKQAESEAARQAGIDALPAQWPALTPIGDRSAHAAGAANLRRELKDAFPGIKFRVTAKSYTGGSSINIKWEFGPQTKAVEDIADKYQECDFDGMQDLETYRRGTFAAVFGGASYVFCSRDYRTAGTGADWWQCSIWGDIGADVCRLQHLPPESNHENQRQIFGAGDTGRDLRQHVGVILSATTFPAGFDRADYAGLGDAPEDAPPDVCFAIVFAD